MNVSVKCLPHFKVLYNLPKEIKVVILIGGRGGAKSYEAGKFTGFKTMIENKRVQILRDEKTQIKQSIMTEILNAYDRANESGVFDSIYTKLDNGIKDKRTGKELVFAQGFRASSNAKRTNLKGISDVDIAIVEEAEDIRNEDEFNTFADSIRKEGSLIIIILNTPDINHWILKRYFNLIPLPNHEGYYDIEPKQIKEFLCIKCDYTNNPFLAPYTRERYDNYGNPESYLYNPHYYLTAIKGYASTGLKGQIFTKYTIISKEQFDEVEVQSVIGVDFGTSSPAGIVDVKIQKNKIYIDELNYKGLATKELAIKLNNLGISSEQLIIADSAEPKTIATLRNGISDLLTEKEFELYPIAATGFKNIYGALKGKDSIKNGIGKLLAMEIYVTERSTNLITEFSSYTWAVDRNGNSLDVPIDAHNHCFTADTLIKTNNGLKKIDKVTISDKVLTSKGYENVLKVFDNGVKEVFTYIIEFENKIIKINSTKNHKIKTDKGWVEFTKLKKGMKVYLNNYSMDLNINCIKEKNIIQEVAKGFMSKFGNFTMVLFQKDFIYIILTKILLTTILIISNVFVLKNIYLNMAKKGMQKIKNGQKNFIQKVLKRQKNGTNLKKALIGIENLQLKQVLEIENMEKVIVLFVMKLLKRIQIIKKCVPTIVKANIEGFSDLIILLKSVNTAMMNLLLINIQKSNAVREAVVLNVQQSNVRKENVYDLHIENNHEYFANELLVHNCIDPTRYVLDSKGVFYE